MPLSVFRDSRACILSKFVLKQLYFHHLYLEIQEDFSLLCSVATNIKNTKVNEMNFLNFDKMVNLVFHERNDQKHVTNCYVYREILVFAMHFEKYLLSMFNQIQSYSILVNEKMNSDLSYKYFSCSNTCF